jgi:hypothetical protein
MHFVGLALAIILFAAASGCGIAATYQHMTMVWELNDRLPEALRLNPIGWYFGKYIRLSRLQKQFMPESPRPRVIRALAVSMFTLFALSLLTFYVSMKY